MKNVFFVTGFLFSSLSGFSQSEDTVKDKRMKLGFNRCTKISNFKIRAKYEKRHARNNFKGV